MPVDRRDVTYISPQDDCEAALLAAVNAAQYSIHVLCYAFTDRNLAEVLKAKQVAGLAVGMVVDSTQAAGHTQKPIMLELLAAGIPLTIARSPAGGIVHQKVIIIDGELGPGHPDCFIISGSFNFTAATAEAQENTLRTVNDPELCAYYLDRFKEVQAFGKAHVKQLIP